MEKLLFCRLTELNCLLVLQLICIEEENDHFSYLERTLSIAVLSDILSRCELNPVVQLLSTFVGTRLSAKWTASTFVRLTPYQLWTPHKPHSEPRLRLYLAMDIVTHRPPII